MAAKKAKYIPKTFESSKPNNDTFGAIYFSMAQSDAWKSLKKNQRCLYMHMKQELHNSKNKPIKNDNLCFCFCRTMYHKKYKLYSNDDQFKRDKDALIEKGFITCEDAGANTRTKAIYRFSSMWQHYGTNRFKIEKSKMSASMLKKQI